MLSHTHRICQDSSNIIKHINIVSSVHKNYSSQLQWFSLNLFSFLASLSSLPSVEAEIRLFSSTKYLSSPFRLQQSIVSPTELRIVRHRMRHFSKSTFNMSQLQAIYFQLLKSFSSLVCAK